MSQFLAIPAQHPLRATARLIGLCMGLWLSLGAYAQTPPGCVPLNNTLIRAAGTAPIYFLRDGVKYHIETPRWMAKNGYSGSSVQDLQPSAVAAIPSGYDLADDAAPPGTPGALEHKLISAHARVYAVQQGVRHWVLNAAWFAQNGYAGQPILPVSDAELQALPLGASFDYIRPVAFLPVFFLTLSFFAVFLIASGNYHPRLLRPMLPSFTQNKPVQRWTTLHTRTILLAFFIVATIAREPNLVSQPRFWAEEGAVWFQYASTHPLLKSLLFVFPASSYFALTANVGAILSSTTAARFGLEYAPLATTLLALLIQIIPLAIILFGHSRLFGATWKRVAACSIVLFASTTTDEIWLNSINAMSFLGLISLLLLFEETWNWPRRMRWVSRGLLIVGGLSSPYCSALIPLFALSAWRERWREQKIQCLILVLCALIEAGVVVRTRVHLARVAVRTHTTPGIGLSGRGTELRADVGFVDVFFGQVALSTLGFPVREDLLGMMGLREAWSTASSFPPRPASYSLQAGGWLCFILLAAILWCLRGTALYSVTNMVIAAFLIFALFTCIASLYEVPLGRYAFLPGLTFLLILLLNIDLSASSVVRAISALLLSFGLANGIMSYRLPQVQIGPPWSKEVQVWQTDHAYPLRTWPAGWQFVYSPPPKH